MSPTVERLKAQMRAICQDYRYAILSMPKGISQQEICAIEPVDWVVGPPHWPNVHEGEPVK